MACNHHSNPLVGHRAGITLIELLIVLAIMGILGTMGLMMRRQQDEDSGEGHRQAVARARSVAIRTGAPVSIRIFVDPDSHTVLLRPDGTVTTRADIPVDLLTGRVRHE